MSEETTEYRTKNIHPEVDIDITKPGATILVEDTIPVFRQPEHPSFIDSKSANA